MTVKELAEFFGKSEDTILRASKKLNIQFENGVQKIFNKNEVELISRSVYRKVPLAVKNSIDELFNTSSNAIGSPSANAEVSTDKIDRLESMMEKLIAITANLLQNNTQPQQPALPPITINPRAKLRELINNYVTMTGNTHGQAWGKFYQACYYHLKINLTVRAENSGMDKLDILESEGLMDKALNLAYEIFK